VAQNVVLDGLLFALAYGEVDRALAAKAGPTVSMLTRFQAEWFQDHCKWVDAVLKTAAAENPENKALLQQWIAAWRAPADEALAPLASLALGDGAAAAMERVNALLNARLAKAGLAAA
jgi:phenol hydroxylase P1 protein